MIRQPIVAVLGHVDHGKTMLLDKIRGTAVVSKEAGGITQHCGACEIPSDVVKNICGKILEKLNIKLEIPGLLFIDTPGHSAFTSIRKRGSSIADLAVLVVDINEGFKPQTDESINFLKEFKTPFLVVANKIDKIPGWVTYKNECFIKSYQKQPEFAREKLDIELYKLIGQLSDRGFEAERFDKIGDFTKQIGVVPISALNSEGIPDLLMVLAGLSQTFLKGKLELKEGEGKGSILEVKETTGMGTTIDVILYDGEIMKDDWIVIGGNEVIVTKIRALLKPQPMKEMRLERKFIPLDKVTAASGIKISAPGLENVIAGNPFRAVREEKDVEKVKKELEKEIQSIKIQTEKEGIVLKADTIGSLEALIHMLKEREIDIRKAEIGSITKKDLLGFDALEEWKNNVIFAFNVKPSEEVIKEAKDRNVKLFANNVIYKIFEDYEEWIKEESKRIKEEALSEINKPGRMKILKGFTFRMNNPAIVGMEILEGELKSGIKLKKDGKEVGRVKQIQMENDTVEKAKTGQRVAVSIEGATVGRQINEGDTLETVIFKNDLKVIEEYGTEQEKKLAREIMS